MASESRLTKTRLVKDLANRVEVSHQDALTVVHALFDQEDGVIPRTLAEGEKVTITNFGTFEPQQRPAQAGYNPQTGEKKWIPASIVVSFRSGEGLKRAIN